MTGRGLSRLCGACLVAMLAVTAAGAQSGRLQVTVFDAEGGRFPGVAVTLANSQRLVAATTIRTDGRGVADFPVLPAGGGYSVEAFAPGSARQVVSGLRVRPGETSRVSIQLSAEFTERVVTRGAREVVDLEKSETSTKFSSEFIQDLPNAGRLYQGVLTLAAGIQDADGDGNPNVHGARFRDFRAEVGGVSNQDPLTGEWMSYINMDSIEEMEVVGTGAGAEFGRAQGGFARIIQKQGSNDLEGSFSVLGGSSRLDRGAVRGAPGQKAPSYSWFQPAVHLSGPIVRDRIWFRASHEYVHRDDPVDTTRAVEIVKRRQTINSDQITWQVSPRNKLALQYQSDPLVVDNYGVSAFVPSASSERHKSGGPQWTLSWTVPQSPRLLVESLVSWQNSHRDIEPMTGGVANSCASSFVDPTTGRVVLPFLERAQCTDLSTGIRSGSGYMTWRDDRQRLTVKSQATFYGGRFLGMTHQLKGGVVVENERYYRYLERMPDLELARTRVQGSDEGGNTKPLVLTTVTARFAVPQESSARVTGTNWAVFLEDQVRPLPNLTATLGVRVDGEGLDSIGYLPFDPAAEAEDFLRRTEGVPYDERSGIAQEVFTAYERLNDFVTLLAAAMDVPEDVVENSLLPTAQQFEFWRKTRRAGDVRIRNVNVAPRIGVTWDPRGDGKTKIALTAGRYYDKIFLAVPTIELEPAVATVTLGTEALAGNLPEFTGIGSGINPTVNVQVVDRNLRTPYQDELTLTAEREIAPETSFRVVLIRREFRDQLQNRDLNHYPYDYGRCISGLTEFGLPVLPPPDGRLDDCDGYYEPPLESSVGGAVLVGGLLREPDGFLDTYTYNPGWGSVFLVGNFNTATYEAVLLELNRRMFRNWQMEASYTWSRAVGDAEDFNSFLGDDRTTLDAERGYLSYDQRHVLKCNATAITPWGFRAGITASWMSGLPYSLLVRRPSFDSNPPEYLGFASPSLRNRIRYLTGQRNDQRNRSAWNFNVKLDKEMNLRRGVNLQVSLEIFNLLNDKRYLIYNSFNGYGAQVNGLNDATVTPGRTYQVGLRVAF